MLFRSIDRAIIDGRVKINNKIAVVGQNVELADTVTLDSKVVVFPKSKTVLLVNKPVGYVCSRDGQGSPTLYNLIPEKYHKLKHIGRLDKDTSGLVVLTDNGDLAHELSHPSFNKTKVYSVVLDRPLKISDKKLIESGKVKLDDKPSFMMIKINLKRPTEIEVELHEGRNRQIRRTFEVLGYMIKKLNRIKFGPYQLSQLANDIYIEMSN